MVRAAALAACILLGSGCQRETFFCDTPEDCTSEDGGGACESTGYCSFPDPECDTGRRYGELAPSGLADIDVYATGAGGALTRVPKDGSPSSLLVTTGGDILGITGDEANVYVTDLQADSVTRVSLFDTEAPAQIATSPGAWGIATDCNNVYWCENGSLSVLRQPK